MNAPDVPKADARHKPKDPPEMGTVEPAEPHRTHKHHPKQHHHREKKDSDHHPKKTTEKQQDKIEDVNKKNHHHRHHHKHRNKEHDQHKENREPILLEQIEVDKSNKHEHKENPQNGVNHGRSKHHRHHHYHKHTDKEGTENHHRRDEEVVEDRHHRHHHTKRDEKAVKDRRHHHHHRHHHKHRDEENEIEVQRQYLRLDSEQDYSTDQAQELRADPRRSHVEQIQKDGCVREIVFRPSEKEMTTSSLPEWPQGKLYPTSKVKRMDEPVFIDESAFAVPEEYLAGFDPLPPIKEVDSSAAESKDDVGTPHYDIPGTTDKMEKSLKEVDCSEKAFRKTPPKRDKMEKLPKASDFAATVECSENALRKTPPKSDQFDLTIYRKFKRLNMNNPYEIYVYGTHICDLENGKSVHIRSDVGAEVQIRTNTKEGIMIFNVDRPGPCELHTKTERAVGAVPSHKGNPDLNSFPCPFRNFRRYKTLEELSLYESSTRPRRRSV